MCEKPCADEKTLAMLITFVSESSWVKKMLKRSSYDEIMLP